MNSPLQDLPPLSSVVIVGAGFGGLCAALELKRSGFDDFVILERADAVGGVWRENDYPGAGCDVPSPYYSFSFAPKSDWPMRYSLQADIHSYIESVVAGYGLGAHIRFGTEVTSARFSCDDRRWVIDTAGGECFEAQVLVPAAGQLSEPAMPNIPGMKDFRGEWFHSARWDHDCDLTGKRVAVIGTGASAIQFVPQIQPKVAQLTLFQRSAPYIVPKPDRAYRPLHHRLFRRLPALLVLERALWWTLGEVWTIGIVGNKTISAVVKAVARFQLRRQVADPVLRAKLTPDYDIGCKRVLFANNYYPAVAQPNVCVETQPITSITAAGVRTADGVEHGADVIIYGTGFAAQQLLTPMQIYGTDTRELHEVWADGARAYLGMAVPGFPNLFLMYGPNTNLGTGSIIYMLERQARYIRQAVQLLTDSSVSQLEVRADVEEHYDDEIQRRLGRSAWAGCSSWYKAASGRISTNWPGRVAEYSRRTKTLRPADYVS